VPAPQPTTIVTNNIGAIARASAPQVPSSPTKLSGAIQSRKPLLVKPNQGPSPPLSGPTIHNGVASPMRIQTSASVPLTKRTSSPLSLPPVQFSPLPPSPKPPHDSPSPQPPVPVVSAFRHLNVVDFHQSYSHYQRTTQNSKNYALKSAYSRQDVQTMLNVYASLKVVYLKRRNGSPSVQRSRISSKLCKLN